MKRFLPYLIVAGTVSIPVILDSAVKGIIVLSLVALSMLAMRRSSAAKRHLVWTLSVVSLLALPVMSIGFPQWRVLPSWCEIGVLQTDRTTDARIPRPSEAAGTFDTTLVGETKVFDSSGDGNVDIVESQDVHSLYANILANPY